MNIPILDAERFRRHLAGLEEDRPRGERTRERLKELAAQLCFLLARYYNRDELDPPKLWERIGSAIATACEQVDDGDLDRYVSIALEHVRASHSRVAADEEWNYLLAEICEQPESDRLALVNYIHHHSYAVLIHGRRYWEQYKDGKENRDDA